MDVSHFQELAQEKNIKKAKQSYFCVCLLSQRGVWQKMSIFGKNIEVVLTFAVTSHELVPTVTGYDNSKSV